MTNQEIIEKINAPENLGAWTPLEGFAFTVEKEDRTVWCNYGNAYGAFKAFRTSNGDWTICNTRNSPQESVDDVVRFAKIVGLEINATTVVETRETIEEVVRENPETVLAVAKLTAQIGVYEKILAREFTVKPS